MNYKIGDKVWLARYTFEKKYRDCIVCFGNREVTVILGDGTHVMVNCEHCSAGFESPTGEESYYEYTVEPELITITDIESHATAEGITYEYTHRISDCQRQCLPNDIIFDTEEEARAKGIELKEIAESNQIQRGLLGKNLKHKSYSHKAGYWIGQANKARKDAERYDKYARICKEKSKIKEAT